MFIGHYSAAFVAAAHPKAPRLGTLMIGAQLVDIAFFTFTLSGVEAMRITPGTTVMNPMDLYHMPFTHSLLGGALWATAFALILRSMTRAWMPAILGGAVVLSHWFLDLLVHAPDLTLAGNPPRLGFGLWNHPAVEMPLEIALVLGGAALFARRRTPATQPLLILMGALLLVQAYNWFAPAPTTLDASLPLSALLAFALFIWLAYRVDKTRPERITS
jgi:hypothetical protein